jgi:co-chaperonin GroES (HSP10)
MTKFEVKGKKLLIQLPEKENVTESGLFIPDTAERDRTDIKNFLGEVLEIGDKVEGICVGDMVFSDPYVEYLGITHPDTKKQCVFANQDNVLSVVRTF